MKNNSLKLLTLLIVLPLSMAVAQSEKNTRTVLFVCEHGAARSVIASAYFNKLAKEKGLSYQSIFRGTNPDSVLTAGTQTGLAKDGFDTKKYVPQRVSEKDVANAALVVTFDCALPVENKSQKIIQKWNGIPPISKNYGIARDAILKRVNLLVDSLTHP